MSLKEKFKKSSTGQKKSKKRTAKPAIKLDVREKMKIIETVNREVEPDKEEIKITQREIENEAEFLIFEIDNNYFAAELRYVQEILELQHITPVPLTKDFFLGLINIRNEIVAVVDLYKILLKKFAPYNRTNKLVVLHADNRRCCIIINRIKEIYSISENMIIKNFDNIEFEYKEFVKSIIDYKERKVPVIDIEKLFLSEIFNKVEG